MRGIYSPTVQASYSQDPFWFTKCWEGETRYDPEGYDVYGYNEAHFDRAGKRVSDYQINDAVTARMDDDFNYAYDEALESWGFDGVKPVKVI